MRFREVGVALSASTAAPHPLSLVSCIYLPFYIYISRMSTNSGKEGLQAKTTVTTSSYVLYGEKPSVLSVDYETRKGYNE